MIKKIGILTSGGDAPGMNDAIISAVRTGINLGKEMYVVYGGYKGLVTDNFKKVDKDFGINDINRGGTIIKSARLPEFKEAAVREKAVSALKKEGIEALIVVGGDGSYMGALRLTEMGINCVGLPGTIDNDIACSEFTIGFDTALNTVVEEIDKIVDTTRSHNRCAVVEIMGNHCADLPLYAGIATNADAIITKDQPLNEEELFADLKAKYENGKEYALVCVAEKLLDTNALTKKIQENTGWESRLTVLGHTQRGGNPTAMERVNAIYMANYAIHLIDQGIGGVCVGLKHNKPIYYPIEEALKMENDRHLELYDLHKDLK